MEDYPERVRVQTIKEILPGLFQGDSIISEETVRTNRIGYFVDCTRNLERPDYTLGNVPFIKLNFDDGQLPLFPEVTDKAIDFIRAALEKDIVFYPDHPEIASTEPNVLAYGDTSRTSFITLAYLIWFMGQAEATSHLTSKNPIANYHSVYESVLIGKDQAITIKRNRWW